MPREVIQTGTPANPTATSRRAYPKSDGWYDRDSAGSEKKLSDKAETSNVPTYGLPTLGAPLNKYDILRGIYNYKSSNTRILEQGMSRAGLATGGMTTHLIIGDSAGAGAVSAVGVTLFDRLRSPFLAMRDQLANIGTPANGTGIIRHVDGNSSVNETRWGSITGSWSNLTSVAQATSAGASATLTPDRDGTVFDYWYFDSTGCTFTISIDGAVSGPGFKSVTASGSATYKYVRLYGVTITANVTTIKVTCTVVGTSGLISPGGDVWSPNSGLIVENASQSGSSASGTGSSAWVDLVTVGLGTVYRDVGGRQRTVADASCTALSPNLNSATAAFTDLDLGKPLDELNISASGRMFPDNCFIGARNSGTQVVIYQGVGASAVPVNAYTTLSSQSVRIGRDPSCVHIELGANDMLGLGASDATIVAAMTTIRGWFPNSDCMLHLVQEAANSYITSVRQATFQKAMYALADTLDVSLYDWRDRVGTFANGQANGVYGDSAVHMTPATYSDLGGQLSAIMGASGGGRPQAAAAPVLGADLTNKKYVDLKTSVLPGNAWVKEACRYVTTAAFTPTTGAPNVVDGAAVVVGDRILKAVPGGAATDGEWTVVTVGSGSNGVWARATDATTSVQVAGAEVAITLGTAHGGSRWVSAFKASDTFGTTAMVWSKVNDNSTGWLAAGATGGPVFTAGWADVGGTPGFEHTVAQKVGNKVISRGTVIRSSGASAIICTLASAMRPARTVQRPAVVNSLGGAVSVDPTGAITVISAYTTGQGLSFDIQFDLDEP